jgi:hypothetical protein
MIIDLRDFYLIGRKHTGDPDSPCLPLPPGAFKASSAPENSRTVNLRGAS